jgi:hypothetical protein
MQGDLEKAMGNKPVESMDRNSCCPEIIETCPPPQMNVLKTVEIV